MDAQEFASDIVEAIKGLSPTQKEEIAEGLARYFWTNQRSRAMQDVRNQIAPRILVSGNEINKDASGNPVGFGNTGKSQFPVINILNATGAVNSSVNGVQADIQLPGGGGDCMFDFLVSHCALSLPGFTEGQVFTTASSCTFKLYSTWQGVMTWLDANSASGGAYTIYLCGTTTESVNLNPSVAGRWNFLYVYGNGASHSGVTGTVAITSTQTTGSVINFYDIGIPTLAANSVGSGCHVNAWRCNFSTSITNVSSSGWTTASFYDCLIAGVTATSASQWQDNLFQGCFFSGNVDLSAASSPHLATRIIDCHFPVGNAIKIKTGGQDQIVGNEWFGSGAVTSPQLAITGGASFGNVISNNTFASPPVSGVAISFLNTNVWTGSIVGNSFQYANSTQTRFIDGGASSTLCATITGNTFGPRDTTPTFFETDGGVSISGKFISSTIGLNVPAQINAAFLAGSSNNVYVGTGTVSGAASTSATVYAPASSAFVTVGNDANLSAERALTAGSGITLTDNGANSTIVINATGGGSSGGTAVGARVFRNTNQSVTDSTTTAVQFDQETEDSGTMHDNVTNNTRITVPQAGKYVIVGYVQFASNSTGKRVIDIRVNGTTFINSQGKAATSGEGISDQEVAAVYPLSANDYVEITCFQNSGGALNIAQASFSVYLIAGGTNSTREIVFIMDGGGSTLATGVRPPVQVPFNCTVNSWNLCGDAAGTCTVDISTATDAATPSFSSIVGAGTKPNVAGPAVCSTATAPASWTSTAITAGQLLQPNLTAVTAFKTLMLALKVTTT